MRSIGWSVVDSFERAGLPAGARVAKALRASISPSRAVREDGRRARKEATRACRGRKRKRTCTASRLVEHRAIARNVSSIAGSRHDKCARWCEVLIDCGASSAGCGGSSAGTRSSRRRPPQATHSVSAGARVGPALSVFRARSQSAPHPRVPGSPDCPVDVGCWRARAQPAAVDALQVTPDTEASQVLQRVAVSYTHLTLPTKRIV